MKQYWICSLLVVLALLAPVSYVFAETNVLSYEFEDPDTDLQQKAKDAIIASGVVEQITSYVNTNLQLPEPVRILFTDTQASFPHYDSKTKTVDIPYEFWVECNKRFDKEYPGHLVGNVLDELCGSVLAYTILRELGVALVDVFNYKTNNDLQTAVTDFAVLTLLDSFQEGRDMALVAGDYYLLEDKELQLAADEVLLGNIVVNSNRALDTYCMAYGVLPDEDLEKEMLEHYFTKERLDECVREAEIKVEIWAGLLRQFGRPEAAY